MGTFAESVVKDQKEIIRQEVQNIMYERMKKC